MTTNGQPQTATVETLTAEVHALRVGNRQVTMSVYNQIDHTDLSDIEIPVFGRVSPRDAEGSTLYVVGKHRRTGALVKSHVIDPRRIEKMSTRYGAHGIDPRDEYGPAAVAAKVSSRYMGEPDFRNHGWNPDVDWATAHQVWADLCELPLIVLAGLR